MPITRHDFADPDALIDALAASIATRLTCAIAARGGALIAVSGGRSPAALFDRLATAPIEWARVTVAQVDERWVDPADPASNAVLIRRHLLTGPAAAARFAPMKIDAPGAAAAQDEVEAVYAALPPPFDLVLLGMGDDGHTASIFPGAPEYDHLVTTSTLVAAATASVAPHERMTLTRAGLLASRAIILQASGAAKLAVLSNALDPGPEAACPVRLVLRQDAVPVELWTAP